MFNHQVPVLEKRQRLAIHVASLLVQAKPQGIKEVHQSAGHRSIAANMLHQAQCAARPQHTTGLGNSAFNAWHAAQNIRKDNGVKRIVCESQVHCIARSDMDVLEWRGIGAGQIPEIGVRFEGLDLGASRIEAKERPSPATNVEHLSRKITDQGTALLSVAGGIAASHHFLRELGTIQPTLQSGDLWTIAHEMQDLFEHPSV